MGVNVKDTKADISTADARTTPNSLNNLPTNPSKKMTGRNTAAKVTEMEITAKNISLDPFTAACIGCIPSSTFLYMFSVTTIPSSTTSPVASTMAKSVRTFTEKPKIHMIKNVKIKETGISIKGRKARDHFLKNRNITKITSVMEIRRVSATS